ncbi:MAG TPA: type VI secretion system contractile sheath large subunit [Pyrinomonadaceae bacterium]|nr:type VI secretion system contractile sheath large subunit [Pyrinomonadaceae bacterium]
MAKEFALEDFEGELVATMEERVGRPQPETPFCIALLGDWSGRKNRGLFASSAELAQWRPLLIDRDNIDQIIAKLTPKLNLPVAADGAMSVSISFRELDDFSPDRIFERLDLFDKLGQWRARLQNPSSFAEAAAEVRAWAGIQAKQSEPDIQTITEEGNAHEGGLLDQILDQSNTPVGNRTAPKVSGEIEALAREAVAPYLVPGPDAQEEELVAAVDLAIGRQMAALLHHPDFQALEAAWRAANLLVSRLNTGTELKLYLLDISREEFAADLMGFDDSSQTAMYKLLIERSGIPWALVAANYRFDLTTDDMELLSRMSKIGSDGRIPFVAEASPGFLGCESIAESPDPEDWRVEESEARSAWVELKRQLNSRYIGLSLPRFLLRLPYGENTEPMEEFNFEEQPPNDKPQHNWYLWGSPSFVVAYLLAEAFTRSGWDFLPGEVQELEGLPLHIYKVDGESETKPCAETLMTLRTAEKIIGEGLMPLISLKDTDVIRLGMLQSISKSLFGVR